ncbi:hypothetical protein BDV38DRAFT_246206 [Aspergillus pseudotamarii]|uniref:Uncharacterized protein n=1 Tax=Aspergillus pseudotamarii TaxID=132259 RepID=A0A5N6SXC1_ASPPS|nr:uncharacterized protein BDV38DRAFT_246206 [Aspergillus pseudotamarii]KAE8137774.1 hypothetical protein BDV38DRAFT_246206 [Aspergillus pseudotamarii]
MARFPTCKIGHVYSIKKQNEAICPIMLPMYLMYPADMFQQIILSIVDLPTSPDRAVILL